MTSALSAAQREIRVVYVDRRDNRRHGMDILQGKRRRETIYRLGQTDPHPRYPFEKFRSTIWRSRPRRQHEIRLRRRILPGTLHHRFAPGPGVFLPTVDS